MLAAAMPALPSCAGTTRVLVVVAVCAGALATAPRAQASWGFELGIGEQGIEMFSDPRFGALGLEHVRLVAPYDVACRPGVRSSTSTPGWRPLGVPAPGHWWRSPRAGGAAGGFRPIAP